MKKSAKRLKKPSKTKSKVKKQKELSYIPDRFRKMVSSCVQSYIGVLGMNHYRAKIFYRKHDKDQEEHNCSCGEGRVAAEATVDMRYLTVHVKVYPWVIEDWKRGYMDDKDITDIIAHEVAHTATNHLYRLATSIYKDEGEMKDAWESLTTIIGRLVHEVDYHRKNKKK